MKLEAGLEYQNCEFVKMQQLYTELFDSYKDKEAEIIERIISSIQLSSDLGKQTEKIKIN